MRDDSIRQKLASIGAEPMDGDAASLQKLISAEMAKWTEVVQQSAIRAD
jgi:hypothetical protein